MKEREYFVNEFRKKIEKRLKEAKAMLDTLESVIIVKNKSGNYYKNLSKNIVYDRKFETLEEITSEKACYKIEIKQVNCNVEKNEYSNIDDYYFNFYSSEYRGHNYIYFSVLKGVPVEGIISKFNEELKQEKERLNTVISNCNYCIVNADELINEVLDAQIVLNEKLKKIADKCSILRETYFDLSFI